MSKIELQDFVQYGKLFSVYGKLLSDDRQKIMTEYFEYNMTLVEIAEEKQISRQAVLDAIDKSCQKLKEFENTLGFCRKREDTLKALLEIRQLSIDNDIKEKVEKLLKEI